MGARLKILFHDRSKGNVHLDTKVLERNLWTEGVLSECYPRQVLS